MNKIPALVGMCGAGKSVAAEFLESQGYKGVYFGGFTMEEIKKRGLEVNPVNERAVREELRRDLGMAAYAKLALPKIEAVLNTGGKCYLDGLYSWDEFKVLHEKYGKSLVLIEVYADKELRYGRLQNRKVRPLTNEEAQARDIAEIENLAKGGPIAFSDYKICNNGDLDAMKKELERLAAKL